MKEDWPFHTWMRLVRRRLPVAVEMAGNGDNREWVMVFPREGDAYRVRRIEVREADYIEAFEGADYDRLLQVDERWEVVGEQALLDRLSALKVRLEELKDPGLTTSPI